MLGEVNIKIDLPMQPGFHLPGDAFFIRYFNLEREPGQTESGAFGLRVNAGVPSGNVGPNRITYDGSIDTLRGTNGQKLLPFDLFIEPPP